ncbi:SUMO-activating enzyme subunit 1-like [Haliotis cracherodii]|uniref:SUMO-activating enzyme subunit 1-like n=1 Tax=Haliotis cracherodii TaxID=6455 RepID=UPI0039E8CB3D
MGREENITEDEAALYDRQIRLWGLDAQRRLRAARVLLVGVKGLGAEVAKNIVLAGIKSITLLDSSLVDDEDCTSHFLVSRADLGKNRAESSLHRVQLLNPMVQISADSGDVVAKDDSFFSNFDVVCVTCCPAATQCRINKICADKKIQFFSGDVFGYYGYMFSDLGEHEYAEEVANTKAKPDEDDETGEPSPKKAKTQEPDTLVVKKCMSFKRLENALNVDWSVDDMKKRLRRTPSTYFIMQVLLDFYGKHKRRPLIKSKAEDVTDLNGLRETTLDRLKVDKKYVPEDFASFCFAELSPVCAVVGGVLGQEIIKAVSQKDQPHNNFFFYNGIDGNGMVDNIGSSQH